jgi:hypothetical protein
MKLTIIMENGLLSSVVSWLLQNGRIVIDKRVEVAFSDTPTQCNVILAFYEVSR